jgi:hypothetical protein
MIGKPQFEHKNSRFFSPGSYYNIAVDPLEDVAQGNGVFSVGVMTIPERGAAAGGRPVQMGFPQ